VIAGTLPPPLAADGPARLLARPGVQACLAALDAPDEETRLVGGCVRDALLGAIVADIDLATTRRPEAVMACARAAGIKAGPTGIEHGTVTLVVGGEPHEVTTLREDVETDGRHAVVRFGRDFGRDAERRDFTINALSLSADGTLHDSTGGVADLEAGRVRFIGEAAVRIREDSLRILRFFRFHARYGRGEPDAEGLAAAIRARAGLDRLSRERVRAEVLKLLTAPRALDAVATLSATGLLTRLIGGVGDLGRLARAAAGSDAAVPRLAALAVQSAADADRLQAGLRLSKAEHAHLRAYAAALAALRSREHLHADTTRVLAALHGPAMLAEVLRALQGEPRPQVSAAARAALERIARDGRPVLPLTGADLVAAGVPHGRAVGIGLGAAQALWLAQGCPMEEAARDRLLAHALAAVAG